MNNNYCNSCGMQVMVSMRICPSCGNRSFSASPPQPPVPPTTPTPSPAGINRPGGGTTIGAGSAPNPQLSGSLLKATIWNRVWARSIDLVLVMVLCLFVISILPSLEPFESRIANFLIDIVISAIVMCIVITLYDAMFLSTWGTSPGKALMGLSVRDSNGAKLSASLAQRRAWMMLGSGLSYMFFFPLLQFINLFYLVKSNSTKWDTGEFGVVLQRPVSGFRRILVIALSVILMLSYIGVQSVLKEINKQEIRQVFLNS